MSSKPEPSTHIAQLKEKIAALEQENQQLRLNLKKALDQNAQQPAELALAPLLDTQVIRIDGAGSGLFGAPRGKRLHQGLDLVVKKGEPVYSPINGVVGSHRYPYASDLRWRGMELLGTHDGKPLAVRLFYMTPSLSINTPVRKGDIIGYAQAIDEKYPGQNMLPHLHVEIRHDGDLKDPQRLLSLHR